MNGMYEGPDVITTNPPGRLTGEQASAEVAARWGHQEISDACALTIASWWQSPGPVGRAFAQLASSGSVSLEALADDISATFDALRPRGTNSPQWRALSMLATWALHHPSRR